MWMDNTARKQCQELEVAVGGPMVKRQYTISLDMADYFVFFFFYFNLAFAMSAAGDLASVDPAMNM